MQATQAAVRPSGATWALLAFAIGLAMAFWVFQWPMYFAWGDEVQFVDPAANAHFGRGFTSMAWPYQTSREFFAGNAPGYSLLLVPWFAVFGFGLEQARWLNVPLALGAVALLIGGLRRVQPDMPAWLQALALSAALLGLGVLVSAGSARYDMLCLLAASWVFWLLAGGTGSGSLPAWLGAGALVFYAGFHEVAALVIVMVCLALHDRRRFVRPGLVLGAGVAVGMGSWLAVLATQGLLAKFFVMLFGSQHTISGQMAKLVMQGDRGVLAKLKALAGLPLLDPSHSVVALLLAAMLVLQMRYARDAAGRLLAWLAVVFAFVLPVALLAIGKFPVYYSWMAFVPSVLLAATWAWRSGQQGVRWAVPAFAACALAAALLGIALRIVRADAAWGDADYTRFNGWVSATLRPDDVVYVDHEAYFAARAKAQLVTGPTYGQTSLVPGIPERAQITAIMVQVDNESRVRQLVGGDWQEDGRFPRAASTASRKLNYVILRRR